MIGQKIGPYEVLAKLGEGGMGAVYRARDPRLRRDVAIKILPAIVASDPDRLARFEREGQALAALNHPHIAQIYGIEHLEGTPCLVMELVEGSPLDNRLAMRPMPVTEAVRIAGEIAEALDAAHAKGIIHRDLKPANVMVTADGQVKVLDFGLAKPFFAEDRESLPQLSTVTDAGTREGIVLGTVAYMSPEQARGGLVDKRTDIWAFGCVLYEMLTGRRPFAGNTTPDTIAAVLEREPDWSLLPISTPPAITRLVRRCLEKDVKRRLRDIGNMKADLDEALTSPSAPVLTAGRSSQRTLIALLATSAVLVAIVAVAWQAGGFGRGTPSSVQSDTLTRFVEKLPDGFQLAPAPAFALAPDGSRIAYVAIQKGIRTIYVRELGDAEPRPLAGTQDADQPFFSPDGRWLGFFAGGKLKKIAISGSAPDVLCDAFNPRGGAWLEDNSIVFAPSPASVLFRVSATGGTPSTFSSLDREMNEASHRWPHALPGGRAIVYAAGPTVTAREWIEAHIVAQSLETGRRQRIVPHGTFPHFAPSGHLLYVQSGIVYAQAFDADRLDVQGDPFPVLNRTSRGGGINGGSFLWAMSSSGLMTYVQGFETNAQLVMVDRRGTERVLEPGGDYYGGPRLSPDGRQIAVTIAGAVDSEIWIHDVVRGTRSRLTSGGRNLWPVWSPDGSQIAYASSRSGSTNVYWRRADGAGTEEQLTTTQHTYFPQSWSAHHAALVLTGTGAETSVRIALLPVKGNREPLPLPIESSIMANFSSDGRWLAYVSNASGRNEVYVRAYPGPGAPVQVSTAGGEEPLWARQGHELFFRHGEALMSVDLRPLGDRVDVGPATTLFTGRYSVGGVRTGYDTSADGQSFLMLKLLQPRENLLQFNLVQNWFETFKQK